MTTKYTFFMNRLATCRVMTKFCTLLFLLLTVTSGLADDWPQWRGPKRDGVWRETRIVQMLPEKLRCRWRTPIGGGFSGPAVADHRVYVTDRVVPEEQPTSKNRALEREMVSGGERILCLDADTGQVLWQHAYPVQYNISYPVGPRATPTVHQGKVYSLGAMGDLFCLDAKSGNVLWQKKYQDDFGTVINLWGMACAPLVDGNLLILQAGGKEGRSVLGLNKNTGREVWHALDSVDPGYASPIIIDVGGQRQLVVWNPTGLYGLDPETGRLLWQQLSAIHMGQSVATPVFHRKGNLLLVTSFFDGPMMVQLDINTPTCRLLWQGKSHSELPKNTDGLHSTISTPALVGDSIYGVCSYGQLRCLKAKTGKRIWETVEATGMGRWWNAFLVKHENRFVLFNEQGELIFAQLSPQGYQEISRSFLIEPTSQAGRRKVVWSHPALANRSVYARNDKEIICIDLADDRQ
jgi:outer membrane protein assembly factor BamB